MATIELALVLGAILLPLTFGMMEYGYLFYQLQQVNNAARHGARVAATVDANDLQGKLAAETLMSGTGMKNYACTATTTVDPDELLHHVQVTITVPYDPDSGNNLLGLRLVPKPSQLKATVIMAKEGT